MTRCGASGRASRCASRDPPSRNPGRDRTGRSRFRAGTRCDARRCIPRRSYLCCWFHRCVAARRDRRPLASRAPRVRFNHCASNPWQRLSTSTTISLEIASIARLHASVMPACAALAQRTPVNVALRNGGARVEATTTSNGAWSVRTRSSCRHCCKAGKPGAIDKHDCDFARYRTLHREFGGRIRDVHRIAALLLRRRRTSYAPFT